MKATVFQQFAAVTLLLASCGGSSPTPSAPRAEAERPTAQASAQSVANAQPDDPRVVCPPGTTQKQHDAYAFHSVWCVDADNYRHGPDRVWWSNGQPAKETTYEHGDPEGPSRGWYEDGAREFERSYRAGKLHGRAMAWHANGKRAAESNWSEGVLIGTAKRWDDKGRPEPVTER